MKLVYFGTPLFSANILSDLLHFGHQIVAVVTKPDRPKGRSGKLVPSAVKMLAQKQTPSIPIYQPEKASADEFVETLRKLNADLFVVVAYGEILSQKILDLPKKGCINVHASLLPKYRGAAPIQRCIMEGEKESGITIMHMVRKMDAGEIILQKSVDIPAHMTAGELEEVLNVLGSDCLIEVLGEYRDRKVKSIPQDESQVTYAPKVELEDSRLDFTRSAWELHNLIRGTNPRPGAWCFVTYRGQKKRLKVWLAEASSRGELVIPCGEGSLSLIKVQFEGGRPLSISEFLSGIQIKQLKF